jgi:histidinol-phosphate/aromatic aminotransferase/cobyric acid decarboxylase-like protein
VSLAPLIAKLPHLVIVNSMSKSHGIAELRPGYAVIPALRARQVRAASLCTVNAAAEFCGLTNRSGRTALCAG